MTFPVAAILLCAGQGTRLSPLTDVVPKPLLHFVDQPIVSYALDALHRLGLREVGMNVHQHVDQFRRWVRDAEARYEALADEPSSGKFALRITVEVEESLRGTGGGIRGVWEAMGRPKGPILVINGDVVASFPLEQMLKVHRRTTALATMLVLPPVPGESAVRLDPRGAFVAELPGVDEPLFSTRYNAAQPVTFGGVSILEPELIERLPAENGCVVRHGIAPAMSSGALIAAHCHEGFWADLGTPRRFAEATRLILGNPDLLGPLWPHGPPDEFGTWIGAGAQVSPTARLLPRAFVASGAVVGDGAEVGAWSVVGGGCQVLGGARLEESVLSHGAVAEGVVRQRVLVSERGVRWG